MAYGYPAETGPLRGIQNKPSGGKAAGALKERFAPAALPSHNLDGEPSGFTTAAWRTGSSENNHRRRIADNRKSERLPAGGPPLETFQAVRAASYEHELRAALAHALLMFGVEQGGFGFFFKQRREGE